MLSQGRGRVRCKTKMLLLASLSIPLCTNLICSCDVGKFLVYYELYKCRHALKGPLSSSEFDFLTDGKLDLRKVSTDTIMEASLNIVR